MLVALTIAGSALAQSRRVKPNGASEPEGYKEAISTAISEFEQNNYVEAREQFARAHALYPNARTFRGLGMTAFELKKYVESTRYLEQALTAEAKPLEGRLRAETAELLARARQYVGTLHLAVEPSSARVSVDGLPVEPDDAGQIRLEVGDHLIELRAEGRMPERRAIQTRGEETIELSVRLGALEAEPVTSVPKSAPLALTREDEPTAQRTPVYKKWWLWTTVGLVAAGGAVAAVLLTRKVEHPEEPSVTPNTPTNAGLHPLWRQ